MIRLSALAAAAALGLPQLASAQGLFDFDAAESGFYAGLFVGGAFPGDADFNGQLTSADSAPILGARNDFAFEDAGTYGVFAGYQLPFRYWTYFHPRLEFEISGFDSDLENARVFGAPQSVSGSQSVTFFLINTYSDIVWRDGQKLVPYLGGGIGLAEVDVSTATVPASTPSSVYRINDEASALASTFAGGVSYRFSSRFELYTEARYYTVYDVDPDQTFTDTGTPVFSGRVTDDLDGSTLTAGLRVRF